MNIIANKQTYWTQANRLVFVETEKGSKASAGSDELVKRGVRIANIFQRIIGKSTDVTIDGKTYHLNTNSYKKFMQNGSKSSIARPSTSQEKGQKLTLLVSCLISCNQSTGAELRKTASGLGYNLAQIKAIEEMLEETHPTDPNLGLSSIQRIQNRVVLDAAVTKYNETLQAAQESLAELTKLKDKSTLSTAVDSATSAVKKGAGLVQNAGERMVDTLVNGYVFVEKSKEKAKKKVKKEAVKAAYRNKKEICEALNAMGTKPLEYAAMAAKRVAQASEEAAERAIGNVVKYSDEIADAAHAAYQLRKDVKKAAKEAPEHAKKAAKMAQNMLSSSKTPLTTCEINTGILTAKAAIHQAKRELRAAITCKKEELNLKLTVVSRYLPNELENNVIETPRAYSPLVLTPQGSVLSAGPSLIERCKAAAKDRSSSLVEPLRIEQPFGSFEDLLSYRDGAQVVKSPDSVSLSSEDSIIFDDTFAKEDTYTSISSIGEEQEARSPDRISVASEGSTYSSSSGYTIGSISSIGEEQEARSPDRISVVSTDSGLSQTSFESIASATRSISGGSFKEVKPGQKASDHIYSIILDRTPTKMINPTVAFLNKLNNIAPLNEEAVRILAYAFDKKSLGYQFELKAMEKALATTAVNPRETPEVNVCRLLQKSHRKANEFLAVYAPSAKAILDQEAASALAASKAHRTSLFEDEGIKV